MTRACFISDLHLCESRPDITGDFVRFLEGPALDCDDLYILGDLFEYWIGDDDLDDPFNASVARQLFQTSRAGPRLHLMVGNRDFLLGPAFASRAGLRILPDPTVIDLNGQRVALSHGDALCTDDIEYQQFRSQVRTQAWQESFLAQPLGQRRAQVQGMRRQSEVSKQQKSRDIMDVSPSAVESLFRAQGYPQVLVHGHTHKPAHHVHTVDGKRLLRIVLSDWRGSGAPCLAARSPLLPEPLS